RAEQKLAAIHIVEPNQPTLEIRIEDSPPRFGIQAVKGNDRQIETTSQEKLDYRVGPFCSLSKELKGDKDIWGSSSFVNIGNDHCCTFVEQVNNLPDYDELRSLSERLKPIAYEPITGTKNDVFDGGCNLHWAWVESR